MEKKRKKSFSPQFTPSYYIHSTAWMWRECKGTPTYKNIFSILSTAPMYYVLKEIYYE